MKRKLIRLLSVTLSLLLLLPLLAFGDSVTWDEAEALTAGQNRRERALLIGIDDFVTKPGTFPSSANNVYAMQEMFQHAMKPLEMIMIPDQPVTSGDMLRELIQSTFAGAAEGDVSYLYISTHGVYDPENGISPGLLLSDGKEEYALSPAELESCFEDVPGTKVIILDACSSGAFIGKGMETPPENIAFQRGDFKVLTSSGAMEQSWYWNGGAGENQGSFYFTGALTAALSQKNGYPADQNRDGAVTLRELYDYLYLSHAASTPQVYPQNDGFVVFRYDAAVKKGRQTPVMDVAFSGTVLDGNNPEITIEFVAMRPVQVAYQLVYLRQGRWEFENARLIYDQTESNLFMGDKPGQVSAGWKQRQLRLEQIPGENYGYALLQLLSIDQGKVSVHGGRVICVLPPMENRTLSVKAGEAFRPGDGQELSVYIHHDYPCALSVQVLDKAGNVVYRVCHRRSTRPSGIAGGGTALYWDGRLKDGTMAPQGEYLIRVQAALSNGTLTALSEPFLLQ